MKVAGAKIVLGVLLALIELNTNHRGLILPTNAEAVGFDIWRGALYLFCLWAGIRTLRRPLKVQGQ